MRHVRPVRWEDIDGNVPAMVRWFLKWRCRLLETESHNFINVNFLIVWSVPDAVKIAGIAQSDVVVAGLN